MREREREGWKERFREGGQFIGERERERGGGSGAVEEASRERKEKEKKRKGLK